MSSEARFGRHSPSQSAFAIEALENRTLLTLWTVTTLDDVVAADGEVSFREAVIAASTNTEKNEATPGGESDGLDEIRFASGLFEAGPASIGVKSAGLDSGPFALDGSDGPISIIGPGPNAAGDWLLALDGQNATGIFTTDTGGSGFEISGLELRNSNTSAIVSHNQQVLKLTDMAFVNNNAVSGGAITHDLGDLDVRDSLFVGNTASGNGGAVNILPQFSGESALFRNVKFINNSAGASGGAIANTGARLTVFDSQLTGNRSVIDGGGIATSDLSGLSAVLNTTIHGNISGNDGGGIWAGNDLTIGNSVVSSNSATADGGGIWFGNSGRLTVTETTVVNNTAVIGAGIKNELRQLTIERSSFSGNVASDKGGAIASQGSSADATIVNSTISGNYARTQGGGILQDDGRLLLINDTIVMNRADADADGTGLGGGLAVDGLTAAEVTSNTQLFNTIIAGNLVGQTGIATTDNSAAGFTETGTWSNVGTGFGGSARSATAGDGSTSAEWTFGNLEPGQYRVLTTWTGDSDRATDASFDVLDGNRILKTVELNQQNAPLPHALEGGQNFQSLGGYTITGGTLVVTVNNDANGRVVADAVRIERIDDGSDIGSLQNAYDIHMAKAGSTINFERSWHNLIGDPKSSAGLPDDPANIANNNFVGNAGDQWNINRIIFTELSDNLGGVTRVHPLKADSPAIDEGSPFLLSATEGIPYDSQGPFLPETNLITSDQRGYPFLRSDDQTGTDPGDFPVDIGAYEVQLNPLLRAAEIVVSSAGSTIDGNYSHGELTFPEAIQIANLRTDSNTIRFSSLLQQEDGSPAVIDLGGGTDFEVKFDLYVSGAGTTLTLGELKIDSVATFTLDSVVLDRSGRILNLGDTTIKNTELSNSGAISNSGTMLIRDSRLENNSGEFGGAIRNSGQMQIGPAVLIQNNTAEQGGAISNVGELTIIDSVVTGNSTSGSPDGQGHGGGIYSRSGRLVIRRSTISNNTANAGAGGGIYADGWLEMFDTTVSGNTANAASSAAAERVGGGVFFTSGLIDRSTINNNTASSPGGSAFGGGILVSPSVRSRQTSHAAIVRSTTVSDNQATGSVTRGGGIYVHGFLSTRTDVKIESSTIALNTANGATGEGAGAYIADSTELSNVLLSDNSATTDSGEDLFFGPGIDVDGPYTRIDGSTAVNPVTHTLAVKPSTGPASIFATTNAHGNLVVTAGLTQTLQQNDGELTATHPLQPSSFAIDSGYREGLLDQRGFPTTDNDFSATRPLSQNGYTIDDGSGLNSADIGAYESAEVVVQAFESAIRGASQIEGIPALGVGFDDGRPVGGLEAEPGFIGLNFNPDPFLIGPGIVEDPVFGTKWGGRAVADVNGKLGFEFGYYLNTGVVDSFYDGLFGYSIDDTKATDGEFVISTSVELTDGAVYTKSPQVGAFLDLVLELNASITGTGCIGGCFGGDFSINIEESAPLLSINRQKTNDNDEPLFIDLDGNETTTRQNGNKPSLDGEVLFVGTSLNGFKDNLLDDVAKRAIEEAGGEPQYIDKLRALQRNAEILKERKLSKDPNADTSAEDAEINDAKKKEQAVTKKKGGEAVGGGNGFTVDFGTADGDLLGLQADLGIGVQVGKVGVGKKLGSLKATIPEINLSATEPDENLKLSATTDSFAVGSDEDNNRQLAALSVDVAAIGPLGTYTVDLGPVGIEATTVSYNITPRLAVGQDISVEPFFDEDHQASFVFENFTDTISVTVGGISVEVNPGDSLAQRTVRFMPGQNLSVDTDPDNDGVTTVDVTPSLMVGQRFSNKLDVEFDILGILEVLKISVSLSGTELFSAGPLYEDTHQLLESLDLFDIYDSTFDLPAEETTLDQFTIGLADGGVKKDGQTPGNAIPLEPGTATTDLGAVADNQERYFSVPLIDSNGTVRTDIRFETNGANPTRVRPPYQGLTLELINIENGSDVVVSSFPIDIGGSDLAGFTTWDGNVWRLTGFENLVGSRAIFGVTFDAVPSSVTATPQGGPDLTAVGVNTRTPDQQQAIEQQANQFVVDNDFAFDIDNDGYISPTTDGELVVRYMRGVTGSELIAGAVGSDAERNTAAEITAYLKGLRDPRGSELSGDPSAAELRAYAEGLAFGRRLDVDDSATIDDGVITDDGIDPDVDGVLILRHMSGIGITVGTGPALTLGDTVGNSLPAGRRRNPQDIADFIDGRIAPPLLTSRNDVNRGSVRREISHEDQFVVAPDAIPGSSPWAPIVTDFTNGQGALTLSTYQDQTEFRDVYLVPDTGDDILLTRSATGTPSRTLPMPESLEGQLTAPNIDEFAYREEKSDRPLGFVTDAPIFVKLPDAAGYRLQLQQANLSVTHLVFDRGVGGNIFRDHTSDDAAPQIDFDVYLPDDNQWLEVSMAGGPFALPTGVRNLELYPRNLVNEDLFYAENNGDIDLDLPVGLVLAGPDSAAPTLNVTALADRQDQVAVDPIFTGNYINSGSDRIVRLQRNGPWLDLTVDGQAVPLASAQGLDFSITTDAAPVIVDNSDPGFAVTSGSWSTVSSSEAFVSDFRRNLAGDGSDKVTWTFDLPPDPTGFGGDGQYHVAVTWAADPANATNAKFAVSSGGFSATVEVDQTQPPASDFVVDGQSFQLLIFGDQFTPFGESLTVELSDEADAGRFVTADAVRIQRVQYSESNFDITDPSILQVRGLPPFGFAYSNAHTLTITDAHGRKATDTFRVNLALVGGATSFVDGIQQPVADQIVPTGTTQKVIELANVFTNSGGNITLQAISQNPLVTAVVSGTTLTLNLAPGAVTAVIDVLAMQGGFPVNNDTFRISVGEVSSDGPIVVHPILNVAARSTDFEIDTTGRYSSVSAITLAATTPYRAGNLPAEQSKPLQLTGKNEEPTTLILDATNGPLYQSVSFVADQSTINSLQIEGGGVEVDIVNRDYLSSVDIVDLRGSGANKLILDESSVATAGGFIVVLADPDSGSNQDTVERLDPAEWTLDRSNATHGAYSGAAFDVFLATVDGMPVQLWVSNTIDAASHAAGPSPQSHTGSTLSRDMTTEANPTQFVATATDSVTIGINQIFTVDVEYRVVGSTGDGPPAILVEAHFDSDLMKFQRVVNTAGAGDFVPSILANNAEIAELVPDNDLDTDSVVVLSWNDIRGVNGNDWPNEPASATRVITLEFRSEGVEGESFVNFTGESSAGYALDVSPVRIVVDNAAPNFTVSRSSLTVSEAATSDTFTVVLDKAPSSNVVLNVSSGDTGEATVTPMSLTFTTGNWNVAQTVTVTGVDDAVVDGNQTTTVTISVNDAASDDQFDPLADQTVSVTTTDDDAVVTTGFTLSKTAASVSESGTTDTFTVVLDDAPTSNVVLNVTSGDAAEVTVAPTTLTFTPANWNTAQTVTITGIDDVAVDGSQATIVTVSVDDAGSDNAFDSLPDQTVIVTTTDNEVVDFLVTTISDTVNGADGVLSLREAIDLANLQAGADVIAFDSALISGGPATISLASGLPHIGDSITISGPGADMLTVSGSDQFLVLDFGGAGVQTYYLNNLTIADGEDDGFGAGGGVAFSDVDDSLIVDGVIFRNNTSNDGGAAHVGEGTALFSNSTFVGNVTTFVGSALSVRNADVTLRQVTISGQTGGPAIRNYADVGKQSELTILNSTIANNTGPSAIETGDRAETRIANSIVADSSADNFAGSGTLTSLGFNISDDASGGLAATGDRTNTDPLLAALGNNGGRTPTHALLSGSPAIDTGDPAFDAITLPNDQRGTGFERVLDGTANGTAVIDVGAFEFKALTGAVLRKDSNGILAVSRMFRVVFTDDVTGVNASDFVVTTTGSVTASPTVSVTDAGDADARTWEVTASGVAGIGTVGLEFSPAMNIVSGTTVVSTTLTTSERYDIIDDGDDYLNLVGRVAGNSAATFSSGTLTLTPDAGDNAFSISQRANGDVIVAGQGGTTINGVSEFIAGNGVLAGLTIAGSSGRDFVTVAGLNVTGIVNITGGDDADSIRVSNVTTGSNLTVREGGGNGFISVTNPNVGNVFRIETADGMDTVNISGGIVSSVAVIDTGSTVGQTENDTVTISGGISFHGLLQLRVGEGDDDVTLNGVNFFAVPNIDTSGGNDTLNITDLTASVDVTMNTGNGNDEVNLMNPAFQRNILLLTGDGNDDVTVTGGSLGTQVNIQTGADTDSITLTNATLPGPGAFKTEGGNDTIMLNGVTTLSVLSIEGGSENDNITLDDHTAEQQMVVAVASGTNSITTSGSSVFKSFLSVNTGTNADTVTLTGTEFRQPLNLKTGGGTNTFRVNGSSTVQGQLTLSGTLGTSNVTIQDSTLADKTRITTGSGNDVVTLSSSDFTGLVAVTTQGGDDHVTINSTGTAPTFGGIVSVQSGASSGTDTISVSGTFNSNLNLRQAAGNSNVTVNSANVTGVTFIATDVGTDAININNSTLGAPLFTSPGNGGDSFSSTGTTFNGDVFIGGGVDVDTVTLTNATINANFNTNLIQGNDVLTLTNTTVTGVSSIGTFTGTDMVTINSGSSLGTQTFINTGSQDDILNLTSVTFAGQADILTGSENDTLNGSAVMSNGNLNIDLGNGNDVSDITNLNAAANTVLNTGHGNDAARFLNSNVQIFNVGANSGNNVIDLQGNTFNEHVQVAATPARMGVRLKTNTFKKTSGFIGGTINPDVLLNGTNTHEGAASNILRFEDTSNTHIDAAFSNLLNLLWP